MWIRVRFADLTMNILILDDGLGRMTIERMPLPN